MLLEFKMENYKSFRDECVFSMKVAPKQKGLDYSILTEMVGNKEYKGVCSAVIYGPNASGKTNIIGAMDTFKQIVLRGNIQNVVQKDSPNVAASSLELIPNNKLETAKPVKFSIAFIESGMLIEYAISLDLGLFLERDYQRKILEESLNVNNSIIFSRGLNLEIGDLKVIDKFMLSAYMKNEKGAYSLAKSSLQEDDLFLTNGFKTMFSAKLVSLITRWLDKNFLVIYKFDSMQLVPKFPEQKKGLVHISKSLNEAATLFGVDSNELGYIVDGKSGEGKLCSVFSDNSKQTAIPVEQFESYGTIRFIHMFLLIVDILKSGGTLVVDELDASIHPMVLMNIITLFHNDELNTKNSQLIFNTHNPIFLNSNLFRRDEIKFIDRGYENDESVHYSLSDFGTSGSKGVRKNEDYMKNYFVDRYGAIRVIDLQPLLRRIITEDHEDNSK
ncbi:MAG: ATP-binding protein [Sphaerochaetaceae bacterium]